METSATLDLKIPKLIQSSTMKTMATPNEKVKG
jgi:hypothetical protein